jgi:hypothetical protein
MTDERIAEIMGWEPKHMRGALSGDLPDRLRLLAREAAQEALQGADVLDENNGQFQRKWSSVGSWLYPGERIVVLRGAS